MRRLPPPAASPPSHSAGARLQRRPIVRGAHRRLRSEPCAPIGLAYAGAPRRTAPSREAARGRPVAWGPVGAGAGLSALLLGLLTLVPGVRLTIHGLAEDIGRILLSGPPRSLIGNLP